MASYSAQSREAGRAPLPVGCRDDAWWKETLFFAVVFISFVIYTTFRTFENAFFCWPWPGGPVTAEAVHGATYLSPFYSPFLPFALNVTLPVLGAKMISPAIYILIFPLSFRMTCYYYRKAYYRSFFRDPAACAAPEPMADARMKYTGERVFPFIVQNFHRFAMYAAIIFIFILAYDAFKAFFFVGPDGGRHFGIGVGTLVLIVNVYLLGGYTFGCHSFRHLIGGGVNCYSCTALNRTRHGLWQKVSFLNSKHAKWAMSSMIWVGLTDVYVTLVARGVIPDLHFILF